jgi:hypothetical protein
MSGAPRSARKGQTTKWKEGTGYETDVTDECFRVRVKRCPPTAWFMVGGIAKDARYSEHCWVLCQGVGERCGFAMGYFLPDEQAGLCCVFRFTKIGNCIPEPKSSPPS